MKLDQINAKTDPKKMTAAVVVKYISIIQNSLKPFRLHSCSNNSDESAPQIDQTLEKAFKHVTLESVKKFWFKDSCQFKIHFAYVLHSNHVSVAGGQ